MEPPPVRYVTTSDGYSIAYAVAGEGKPLVRMPSPFSTIELNWRLPRLRFFTQAVVSRFSVVQYDSRGQGMSGRYLRESHGMEDYELDLEAVVDRLGLERFLLFGGGMFGHSAVRFAARQPDRVAGLILMNVGVHTDRVAPLLLDLPRTDWRLFQETVMPVRLGLDITEGNLPLEIFAETVTQGDWLKIAGASIGSSVEAIAPKLMVPTLSLIVTSQAWAFSSEENCRRLAALIPGARAMVVDGRGVSYERVQQTVVQAIRDFGDDVFTETAAPAQTAQPTISPLSNRELEVLRLIAEGKSNRQIAAALVISPNTVGRHVGNIFSKIGVANRAEATSYAHRNRLI